MDYYDEKLDRSGEDLKGCFLGLVAIVLMGMAGFMWGRCSAEPPTDIRSDTVEVVVFDTIHDTLPEVRYERITRYVPVPDSVFVRDTVTNEPMLPVVQRKYSDDSTYTAYVSGARIDSFPRLDSIDVYRRTIERTVTNTIYKQKHWRFGVGATAGVSVTTRKPDIVLGGFVGYTF